MLSTALLALTDQDNARPKVDGPGPRNCNYDYGLLIAAEKCELNLSSRMLTAPPLIILQLGNYSIYFNG